MRAAPGARFHLPEVEPRPAIGGKYLSIMSYRRDGTGVATPVWFVEDGDRLLVMTGERSGKVKRIRREPRIGIAACSPTGKLVARPVPARAEILPGSEVDRAKRLIADKYRADLRIVRPIRALQAWRHPERRDEPEVILAITPTSSRAAA